MDKAVSFQDTMEDCIGPVGAPRWKSWWRVGCYKMPYLEGWMLMENVLEDEKVGDREDRKRG